MYTKLVSVIITTHNRRELVSRAINSVFMQTYSNMELIVVDDHSEDNIREVCQDPRIKYVYIPKEESRGGNYARNLGIKVSKGEYCAFLDDDDYWLPTKIEKQVAIINQMDCELVHCGRRKEYVGDVNTTYRDQLPNPECWGDMHLKILTTICTTTSCILVKRQALIDVGMFDENLLFWQEYELTIRLAQRKPFYYVNEPLVVYRIDARDGNRLTNKYFAWRDAVKYIHKKHASLYSQLSFFEKFKAKNLIWRDAMKRCKLAGFRWRFYAYFTLNLPFKIMTKINNCL